MINPSDAWSVAGDLDDYIATPLDEEMLASPPTPVPDASRANIALRRLMRLDDNADQIKQWAADEHARIDDWLSDRMHSIDRERTWITRSLEAFMRQHAEATRETSLSLPNGKLSLRKPSTRTEIQDADALLAWAKENLPEIVHVVESVQATAVKTRLTPAEPNDQLDKDGDPVQTQALISDDGEIVPGVRLVTPANRTFSVKAGA